MKIYTCTVSTPIGAVTLTADDNALVGLDLDTKKPYTAPTTSLLYDVRRQLDEFFAGTRLDFDIPISLSGTDFQLRVWEALRTIPYGATASYSDVAAMVHNPLAARAVGNANNKNPIAIIVPCHRVINANGSLGGYGGGEYIKQFLLDLEASTLAGLRCGK